jgi:tetratricopeptide (TPR) repeat protein
MLLDGRLAASPLIASLPSSYRRAEGFTGVGSTLHSPPPTTQYNPQERRGVLGFDIFSLESTTSSSSDIDAGFMAESSGASASPSTLTASLGITWHDANWKSDLERNRRSSTEMISAPCFPTRSQIDQFRVAELKQACLERGLSRVSDTVVLGKCHGHVSLYSKAPLIYVLHRPLTQTGNKAALQERLWKWSLDQRSNVPVKITGDFLSRIFDASDDSDTHSTDGDRKDAVDAITRIFDDSTYTPSSLAEWARNIDLEPLLQKRKEIHRQMREGRPAPTQLKVFTKREQKDSHEKSVKTANYRKSLARAVRAPSSPYASNIQVKELYAASKQADQLGDRKVAMDLLQTLLMVTPNDARVYRRLARMYSENDNVQKARETLQAGLERQGENPWLWHGLGQLELTHGSIELAKEHFQKAIDIDAAFAQSYHALGTLEHGQGNVANATRILKKGLEFCPTNHRLWHAYGDVYREAQMLEDAERSYKRAIEHGPPTSHCFAHSSLAAVAYEQGRIDSARRWLFKAIEANNGRHSQGWVALAQLEESQGNIREARLLCTSAIAQYERGLLEARQRYLEKSGQRQVNPRPTISADGPISVISADGPISVQLTNQLLKQVPAYRSGDKFVHVYRNWARLEELHGMVAAVDRVYERARAAFPQDSKLLVSWAHYHERNLNVERAREIYQEACTKAGQRYVNGVVMQALWMNFFTQATFNIFPSPDTPLRTGCLGSWKCLSRTFMKRDEFYFLVRVPLAKLIS